MLLPLRSQPELTDALIEEGVVLLNSTAPAEWIQARDHYIRLSTEYPSEASPLLFLGLTYHRMGLVEQGERSLLDAYKKKNVETAIRRGLQSEPDSKPLKLSLGKYYLFLKKKPAGFARDGARCFADG